MWEDGKRFPDEERPKLPWDDEPEEIRRKRKKAAWERFENAEKERKKIIVFSAVVGVIAAFIIEVVCYQQIPGTLLERIDHTSYRNRWMELFSILEIAGGLVGAGIGWLIARLLIGY